MINLILCGGSGTRLWPMSRKGYPKQFVGIIGEESLFQHTVKRNLPLCDKTWVVTNRDNYFMAMDQINALGLGRGVDAYNYFLEPVGRNTAPAIAIACFDAGDQLVLVTPSDHLIGEEELYLKALQSAMKSAEEGFLVTFGIRPVYPETGYGYIESEQGEFNTNSYPVKSFREKPDYNTATEYVNSGRFFWNSGMFMFKASVFLEELKKYSPDIYEASLTAYKNSEISSFNSSSSQSVHINQSDMMNIPSNSIDFAVMEKTDRVKVVPSSFVWNDLGSFDSLYEVRAKDENGNTLDPNLISVDSRNNLVLSHDRKIATVGLENTIIIDTPDALLVGQRGHSQDVKRVVDFLNASSHKHLAELHATVHRPWGTYTVLEEGDLYKIKKIIVRPGSRLSIQKHLHRSEHWVVVSGTATVLVGEKEFTITKNESTYIPIGEIHRLSNFGKIDLVIIETQVGEYVGEDDIIRLEDDYKRATV